MNTQQSRYRAKGPQPSQCRSQGCTRQVWQGRFAVQGIFHKPVPVVRNEDFDLPILLQLPLSDKNDTADEAHIELEVAQSPPSAKKVIATTSLTEEPTLAAGGVGLAPILDEDPIRQKFGFDFGVLERNRLAGCTESLLLSVALPGDEELVERRARLQKEARRALRSAGFDECSR